MNPKGRKSLIAGTILFIIIFQILGLLRYIDRMGDDTLGVVLYIATIVGLVILSTILFNRNHQRIS